MKKTLEKGEGLQGLTPHCPRQSGPAQGGEAGGESITRLSDDGLA